MGKLIKALAASALIAALPVSSAVAASASGLSVQSALSGARASSDGEGSELAGGNIVIVLLALAAAGLGIYTAVDEGDEDDLPTSP